MGNQGSSSNKKDGRSKCPPEEPLESYLREKQRNDHLQNLGLKSMKKVVNYHFRPGPVLLNIRGYTS